MRTRNMKRLLPLILGVTASSASFGQAIPMRNDVAQAKIITIENAGWNAWKNKDSRWYRDNTTKDVLWINADGITDKVRFLKDLPTDCDVAGFSLANYRFGVSTADTIIMTYTATQDAVCGGKTLPKKVRASVVYVRRGGKWLEALYMETPEAR